MLILPEPPRRVLLQSFGLVLSLCAGLLASAIAWLSGLPIWWGLGIVVALLIALSAWIKPEIAAPVYRAWNRLADAVVSIARRWLVGTCYLIIAIAGRPGTELQWRRPSEVESGWYPRAAPRPDTYESQSDLAEHASGGSGWVKTVLSWSWRSGNVWVWVLIPFLLLLSTVQAQPRSGMLGSTYTLY